VKYRSVFDIIGPVMVGPSSSHTAGAVRIGRLARALFGRSPATVKLRFFGSFAKTFRGHATDVAALAGVLGLEEDDPRIPNASAIAGEAGIKVEYIPEDAVPAHPNTLAVELSDDLGSMSATGISLGGGLVQMTEVDGFSLRLSGDSPALLIFHRDAYGTIASITRLLADECININHMEVSRADRGQAALMVKETDGSVPTDVLERMAQQNNIFKIITLDV
jgi:L-serine dehydratase